MNKAGKTYMLQFGAAMVAYALVLIFSILIIRSIPSSPWRVLVALLPIVPVIFGLLAFVRFLDRMDELQRRIQLEALAFGFGGTAILSFAYGFLENVGFPRLNWTWVLPLMTTLWGIGTAIASRRYR